MAGAAVKVPVGAAEGRCERRGASGTWPYRVEGAAAVLGRPVTFSGGVEIDG